MGKRTEIVIFVLLLLWVASETSTTTTTTTTELSACTAGEFQCNNGRCVSSWLRCNGRDSCGDNSDETECQPRDCAADEFRCKNGYICIKSRRLCDGYNTCGDNSDEDGCPSRACPGNKFRCKNGYVCVESKRQCDGVDNCGDNSDEENCSCPVEYFTCRNGKCVWSGWRCDGHDQCGDKSDEYGCPTRTCEVGLYTCACRICLVPRLTRCNRVSDCWDNSDEDRCDFSISRNCPEGFSRCRNEQCIFSAHRCDGKDDCGDNSDEEGCLPIGCGADQFRCDTMFTCISAKQRCDGNDDCGDGSDENGCEQPDCSTSDYVLCSNGYVCISTEHLCNGRDDCGDNSDEDGCPNLFCALDEYLCRSGKCVRSEILCDGQDDCGDNSDEDGCLVNQTSHGQRQCPARLQLMNETRGVEVWEGDVFYNYCNWWIQVNSTLGIVLQFHDVSLQLNDHPNAADMLRVHDGALTRTYFGDGIVEPVVLTTRGPAQFVWFELISYGRNSSQSDGVGVSDRRVSRFQMNYTTYPRHTLPPELEVGVYNCSPPYIVPQELQCNGIAQCLDGEDELDHNCSYTHLGCDEGWIAGESFCLKFVFPSTASAISPDSAKSECLTGYNTDLGPLAHHSVRRLATRLMSRMGYSEMIVGLRREQAGSLYRFLWHWTQASTEFGGPEPKPTDNTLRCATLTSKNRFKSADCSKAIKAGYVCATLNYRRKPSTHRSSLRLVPPSNRQFRLPVKECISQHFVQTFHPCTSSAETDTMPTEQLSLLSCKNGRLVHYTTTCDGYDDCGDMTDEMDCAKVLSVPLQMSSFQCKHQTELVDRLYRCNGKPDCHDGSDEENCEECAEGTMLCEGLGCMPCGAAVCAQFSKENKATGDVKVQQTSTLKIIGLNGVGLVSLTEADSEDSCPESHFLCGRTTTNKYCIPTFLVGNGQRDCPEVVGFNSSDDEPPELTCPGHYRCYQHNICVHPVHVCDGVYHCPLKDDERYCDLPCPQHCACEGQAYTCTKMFDPSDHLHVRYLDLSGIAQPTVENLHYMGYLHFLNLSRCGLTSLAPLENMIHLKVLDLSFNKLNKLALSSDNVPAVETLKLSSCGLTGVSFGDLVHLRELDLSANEITFFVLKQNDAPALERLNASSCRISNFFIERLEQLRELDLSNNTLSFQDQQSIFNQNKMPALEFLNLSSCGLTRVSVEGLGRLRVLDLSSNRLTAVSNLYCTELRNVTHLYLSNNPFLPQLGGEFQSFLMIAGMTRLVKLFLSNTGIKTIETNPFAGMETRMHLDITQNIIRDADELAFANWTELDLFETSSISVCCAYYKALKEHHPRCKTVTEIIFQEQCNTTARAEKVEDKPAASVIAPSSGCDEGWLPYASSCLRFVFPVGRVTANTANIECREKFHAELAAIPTQEAKEIASRFLELSGFEKVIVGLEKAQMQTHGLRYLYRFLWQWTQAGTAFDGPELRAEDPDLNCVTFSPHISSSGLDVVNCQAEGEYAYVCSKAHSELAPTQSLTTLTLPQPSGQSKVLFPRKICADETFVHSFYSCNGKAASALGSSAFFICRNGQRVHYTVTCDGSNDCGDGSDEEKCRDVRSERLMSSSFLCTRQTERVNKLYRCNGMPDCLDGSDEENCGACSEGMVMCEGFGCLPEDICDQIVSPALDSTNTRRVRSLDERNLTKNSTLLQADLNRYGVPSLTAVESCPETHFECQEGYCIPAYMVHNGQPDCPNGLAEDETSVEVRCPGHYRCYQHQICLHPDYVCDGVYHCPLKDDEKYCNLSCPANCTCEGFAYSCSEMFDPADHLHVRYLDLSGSIQPPLDTLHYMGFLHFLNLSSCGLNNISIPNLVLVRVLDLSFNGFTSISSLALGEKYLLAYFNISGNPLRGQLGAPFHEFLVNTKMLFLKSLGLRSTGIRQIEDHVFMNMSFLKQVDIRGNRIRSINKYMFNGLMELEVLETDDPRLCCPYFYLYGEGSVDCRTSMDELSSCSDLLRSDFLRASLWTMAAMAIFGNVGVLIYRVFLEVLGSSAGFRVLVANLCVADFLMGVYMVIIGGADAHYSGQYIWKRESWTQSGLCHTAGFLALLSSEVSAFVICLITLDRLLVLQFPLHRHLHLTTRSALMACGAAWIVGLALALLPFVLTAWTFYGETGICLPLPITRKPFSGQQYALGVFVVLNFFLFLLIGAGQLFIYHAIRNTPMASKTLRRKQDMAIARRLFLIVFSDFCCWFPIGLMGLLVFYGTPIPGEVNVWAAVFILPVNSAINPFLYTLSMLVERWVKRREEKRVEKMLAKLHVEMISWSEPKVQELFDRCEQLLGRMRASRRAATFQTRKMREAAASDFQQEDADTAPLEA